MIKKAGSKKQGSIVTLETEHHSDAEVASSSRDDVSQKLDALVKAVTDLSKWVESMEEHLMEGGASHSDSPSTSFPRRRAKHQETTDQTPEVADVRQRVAKRLKELDPSVPRSHLRGEYTSD